MFKVGIGNELGISYRWYDFGISKSQVRVRVMVTTTIRRGFELYEYLLLQSVNKLMNIVSILMVAASGRR